MDELKGQWPMLTRVASGIAHGGLFADPAGYGEAMRRPVQTLGPRLVRSVLRQLELGVDVPLRRLLCTDRVIPDGEEDPHGALMMVDGGVCGSTSIERFVVPAEELRSLRFFAVDELAKVAKSENVGRGEAALGALHAGTVAELEASGAS